ncbi:ferredoxin [Nocardia sp. NPDC059239]|uniref:ferredoxin n=1 Tax=unclassified Nocardia TaxID=2637762 RepID=UPI0036A81702
MMKFTVNRECSGHARCFELAPEVYEVDSNGYNVDIGETVPVSVENESAAILGARICPERAIIIEG